MYNKKAHIHFVGIGGIGMSGIAKILKYQGYTISGCDQDVHQQSIYDLTTIGCSIYEGNNTSYCNDTTVNILVYSSAINRSNPEILAAQQRGIPTIGRALMLAELMRTKYSIAIAGAHGKTTTTSLIAHILIEAHKDPTVIVGGHLKNIATNANLGKSDFLVAEADESDRSLIHLQPTLAVVTNIDLEHLDVYADIDDIKNTFKQFLNNLPFYGKAILCTDDPHVRSLLPLPHLKVLSYSLDSSADIYANELRLAPDYSTFTAYSKYQKEPLGSLMLTMPGRHNVLNALAALTVTLDLDIPFETIARALATFKGIDRRFSYKGTYRNTELFDDYGHHPEEIKNTLIVARNRSKGRLIVVFQPHRYTRTHKLWDLFIDTFLKYSPDSLIITDIYPASEESIPEITSQNLVKDLQSRNPNFTVSYIPYESHFNALRTQLDACIAPNDLVLLLGAGKINKLATILNVEH